jgi:hypothetical protein
MKIEFTRAEIEAIILAHVKDEIAPYRTFRLNPGNCLPEYLTLYSKEKDAAQ